MRLRRFRVGEHKGEYAVLLDEVDETGKLLGQSVVVVGLTKEEAEAHVAACNRDARGDHRR